MCDMFLKLKSVYFTGYAHDNTPIAAADNNEDVIRSLEEVDENLITGFFDNQMKLNPDKHRTKNEVFSSMKDFFSKCDQTLMPATLLKKRS